MQCADALSKFVFRDGSSTLLANVFANAKRCAGKNPPDRLYWRVIDLPGWCGAVVLLRWWCPGPGSHQHCGGHYHCTLGSDRDIGQADILLAFALSPSNLQGARGFGRKAVIKMTKYHKPTKDSCGLIVKKNSGCQFWSL